MFFVGFFLALFFSVIRSHREADLGSKERRMFENFVLNCKWKWTVLKKLCLLEVVKEKVDRGPSAGDVELGR